MLTGWRFTGDALDQTQNFVLSQHCCAMHANASVALHCADTLRHMKTNARAQSIIQVSCSSPYSPSLLAAAADAGLYTAPTSYSLVRVGLA